ncbi:MAG: hydroxymethylbilane synthase [Archangium sp.]
MKRFIAGTRGSALALWQTRHVASLLAARGIESGEQIITTKGDIDQSSKLVGKLEKGFFTEELEAALRAKEIDWAVHSLKDLPTRMPPGLVLGAVLERAPAADLLLVQPSSVDDTQVIPVKSGGRVGSSSLRRESLLKHFAPSLSAQPLRGNVPTRVQKLADGQYDAIVLAEAGVTRLSLDLSAFAVFRLNPVRWQCAPGQGAVAVQCRADDDVTRDVLSRIDHPITARATGLERDFLRILEGGCTTPFGCFIDGARASLGLATDAGWRSLRIDIPASTDGAWLQARLDELNAAPTEVGNDWLTRRV